LNIPYETYRSSIGDYEDHVRYFGRNFMAHEWPEQRFQHILVTTCAELNKSSPRDEDWLEIIGTIFVDEGPFAELDDFSILIKWDGQTKT
jgi:hypothetical protein